MLLLAGGISTVTGGTPPHTEVFHFGQHKAAGGGSGDGGGGWSKAPPLPAGPRRGCRAVACALPGDRPGIAVCGGADAAGVPSAAVQCFDVRRSSWLAPGATPQLSVGRAWFGAAADAVAARWLLVAGGVTGSAAGRAERTVAAEMWVAGAGRWLQLPQMGCARGAGCDAVDISSASSSAVAVCGGQDHQQKPAMAFTVEVYEFGPGNEAGGAWRVMAELPTWLSGGGGLAAVGGCLIIVGGEPAGRAVALLEPPCDAGRARQGVWRPLCRLPGERAGSGCCTITLGGGMES